MEEINQGLISEKVLSRKKAKIALENYLSNFKNTFMDSKATRSLINSIISYCKKEINHWKRSNFKGTIRESQVFARNVMKNAISNGTFQSKDAEYIIQSSLSILMDDDIQNEDIKSIHKHIILDVLDPKLVNFLKINFGSNDIVKELFRYLKQTMTNQNAIGDSVNIKILTMLFNSLYLDIIDTNRIFAPIFQWFLEILDQNTENFSVFNSLLSSISECLFKILSHQGTQILESIFPYIGKFLLILANFMCRNMNMAKHDAFIQFLCKLFDVLSNKFLAADLYQRSKCFCEGSLANGISSLFSHVLSDNFLKNLTMSSLNQVPNRHQTHETFHNILKFPRVFQSYDLVGYIVSLSRDHLMENLQDSYTMGEVLPATQPAKRARIEKEAKERSKLSDNDPSVATHYRSYPGLALIYHKLDIISFSCPLHKSTSRVSLGSVSELAHTQMNASQSGLAPSLTQSYTIDLSKEPKYRPQMKPGGNYVLKKSTSGLFESLLFCLAHLFEHHFPHYYSALYEHQGLESAIHTLVIPWTRLLSSKLVDLLRVPVDGQLLGALCQALRTCALFHEWIWKTLNHMEKEAVRDTFQTLVSPLWEQVLDQVLCSTTCRELLYRIQDHNHVSNELMNMLNALLAHRHIRPSALQALLSTLCGISLCQDRFQYIVPSLVGFTEKLLHHFSRDIQTVLRPIDVNNHAQEDQESFYNNSPIRPWDSPETSSWLFQELLVKYSRLLDQNPTFMVILNISGWMASIESFDNDRWASSAKAAVTSPDGSESLMLRMSRSISTLTDSVMLLFSASNHPPPKAPMFRAEPGHGSTWWVATGGIERRFLPSQDWACYLNFEDTYIKGSRQLYGIALMNTLTMLSNRIKETETIHICQESGYLPSSLDLVTDIIHLLLPKVSLPKTADHIEGNTNDHGYQEAKEATINIQRFVLFTCLFSSLSKFVLQHSTDQTDEVSVTKQAKFIHTYFECIGLLLDDMFKYFVIIPSTVIEDSLTCLADALKGSLHPFLTYMSQKSFLRNQIFLPDIFSLLRDLEQKVDAIISLLQAKVSAHCWGSSTALSEIAARTPSFQQFGSQRTRIFSSTIHQSQKEDPSIDDDFMDDLADDSISQAPRPTVASVSEDNPFDSMDTPPDFDISSSPTAELRAQSPHRPNERLILSYDRSPKELRSIIELFKLKFTFMSFRNRCKAAEMNGQEVPIEVEANIVSSLDLLEYIKVNGSPLYVTINSEVYLFIAMELLAHLFNEETLSLAQYVINATEWFRSWGPIGYASILVISNFVLSQAHQMACENSHILWIQTEGMNKRIRYFADLALHDPNDSLFTEVFEDYWKARFLRLLSIPSLLGLQDFLNMQGNYDSLIRPILLKAFFDPDLRVRTLSVKLLPRMLKLFKNHAKIYSAIIAGSNIPLDRSSSMSSCIPRSYQSQEQRKTGFKEDQGEEEENQLLGLDFYLLDWSMAIVIATFAAHSPALRCDCIFDLVLFCVSRRWRCPLHSIVGTSSGDNNHDFSLAPIDKWMDWLSFPALLRRLLHVLSEQLSYASPFLLLRDFMMRLMGKWMDYISLPSTSASAPVSESIPFTSEIISGTLSFGGFGFETWLDALFTSCPKDCLSTLLSDIIHKETKVIVSIIVPIVCTMDESQRRWDMLLHLSRKILGDSSDGTIAKLLKQNALSIKALEFIMHSFANAAHQLEELVGSGSSWQVMPANECAAASKRIQLLVNRVLQPTELNDYLFHNLSDLIKQVCLLLIDGAFEQCMFKDTNLVTIKTLSTLIRAASSLFDDVLGGLASVVNEPNITSLFRSHVCLIDLIGSLRLRLISTQRPQTMGYVIACLQRLLEIDVVLDEFEILVSIDMIIYSVRTFPNLLPQILQSTLPFIHRHIVCALKCPDDDLNWQFLSYYFTLIQFLFIYIKMLQASWLIDEDESHCDAAYHTSHRTNEPVHETDQDEEFIFFFFQDQMSDAAIGLSQLNKEVVTNLKMHGALLIDMEAIADKLWDFTVDLLDLITQPLLAENASNHQAPNLKFQSLSSTYKAPTFSVVAWIQSLMPCLNPKSHSAASFYVKQVNEKLAKNSLQESLVDADSLLSFLYTALSDQTSISLDQKIDTHNSKPSLPTFIFPLWRQICHLLDLLGKMDLSQADDLIVGGIHCHDIAKSFLACLISLLGRSENDRRDVLPPSQHTSKLVQNTISPYLSHNTGSGFFEFIHSSTHRTVELFQQKLVEAIGELGDVDVYSIPHDRLSRQYHDVLYQSGYQAKYIQDYIVTNLISHLVFLPDQYKAQLALSTLRNLYRSTQTTEVTSHPTMEASSLPGYLAFHRYFALPLRFIPLYRVSGEYSQNTSMPSFPKSLEEDSWNPANKHTYSDWICNLVGSLIDDFYEPALTSGDAVNLSSPIKHHPNGKVQPYHSFVRHESPFITALSPLAYCQVSIAESLFPLVMFNMLTSNGSNSNLSEILAHRLQMYLLNPQNSVHKATQLAIRALIFLLRQDISGFVKDSNFSRAKRGTKKLQSSKSAEGGLLSDGLPYSYLLPIDYSYASEAALRCGLSNTALLFEQLGQESREMPNRFNPNHLRTDLTCKEKVPHLLGILQNLHDPDAIHGLDLARSLEDQSVLYENRGEWVEFLLTNEALIQSKYQNKSSQVEHSQSNLSKALSNLHATHTLSLIGQYTQRAEQKHTNRETELWQATSLPHGAHTDLLDWSVDNDPNKALYWNPASALCLNNGKGLSLMREEVVMNIVRHFQAESALELIPSIIQCRRVRQISEALSIQTQASEGFGVVNKWKDRVITHGFTSSIPSKSIDENLRFLSNLMLLLSSEHHIDYQHPLLLLSDALSQPRRKIESFAMAPWLYDFWNQMRSRISQDTRVSASYNTFLEIYWRFIECQLNWRKGLRDSSTRSLQLLTEKLHSISASLDAKPSNRKFSYNISELLSAIYRTGGEWKSALRASTDADAIQTYLLPAAEYAVSHKEKIRCQLSLAQFNKSLFLNLKSKVESTEWKQGARILNDRQAEYEECKVLLQQVKNQRDGSSDHNEQVDQKALYRHMISLRKELDMDIAERNSVEQSVERYLIAALEGFQNVLQMSTQSDLDVVFQWVNLWLTNALNLQVNKAVEESMPGIESYKLTPLIYQLISRLGRSLDIDDTMATAEESFQAVLSKCIHRLCLDHPYHSLTQLLALVNEDRMGERYDGASHYKSNASNERVDAASRVLEQVKKSSSMQPIAQSIQSILLQYIELAKASTESHERAGKTKEIRFKEIQSRGKRFNECLGTFEGTLPPVLTHRFPVSRLKDYRDLPKMTHIASTFSITDNGLSRPKIIVCSASDGLQYRQLVKGGDDMRQDAVMEQVFENVNYLLHKDPETQKRRLKIRTYKVIPTTPQTGVLEWVDGTRAFGSIITDRRTGLHDRYYPSEWTHSQCREYLKAASDHAEREKRFLHIQKQFHPSFRFFFVESFSDPTQWMAAKMAFTRSVATNSMVGYILGIGDRHAHNILIDTHTGETVHIDFGIVYEQGKGLGTPETVPFRLTREFIDGMGPLAGLEGSFRCTCQGVLQLLRQNAAQIMTIIEVVIYDPLYKWSLSPVQARMRQNITPDFHADVEASRPDDDASKVRSRLRFKSKTKHALTNLPSSTKTTLASGKFGKDAAERTLQRIRNKLNGQEDLFGEALSPQGQVELLINQATNPKHLSKIFHGWSPWL